MSLVIWKLVVSRTVDKIMVPAGAEMLFAREQNEQVCVWFRCDPTLPNVSRTIVTAVTGHTGAPDWEHRYLGSAFIRGLVIHVFEPKQD